MVPDAKRLELCLNEFFHIDLVRTRHRHPKQARSSVGDSSHDCDAGASFFASLDDKVGY